jgi:hypothetical protein
MHAPPHFASFVSMQHDRWNAGITAHGATRCRLTVAQRHAITASLVRETSYCGEPCWARPLGRG